MRTGHAFQLATGFTDISAFSAHVTKMNEKKRQEARKLFLEKFDEVVEYRDAAEWARAVALCEALAIVGWGERERVDAKSHFNGDCWETYFVNAKGENRYLETLWTKRKGGWRPFNPEYHHSPDRPSVPDQDWQVYKGTDVRLVDVATLPSQRNYQRQMPILMGMYGGSNKVSELVGQMRQELDAQFTKHIRPEIYGDALEFFYMTVHCPFLDTKYENKLKIGNFNAKNKSYYCDLYFSKTFVRLSTQKQQGYFKLNFDTALDHLEKKFEKKKIAYNFTDLRADMDEAFNSWGCSTSQ